jgi:hypothetical protein
MGKYGLLFVIDEQIFVVYIKEMLLKQKFKLTLRVIWTTQS